MSSAAMFFVDGFEDVEAFAPLDILRRGGVQLDAVSLTGNKTVTSARNVKIETDILYEAVGDWNYDMLILPGGPGTEKYMEYNDFLTQIKTAKNTGVKIGAICAAPSILGRLGLLNGKKAVCYPGYEKYLEGAEVLYCPVITDENITTSRGMGTALKFGFELLGVLEGDAVKNEIMEKTVYA